MGCEDGTMIRGLMVMMLDDRGQVEIKRDKWSDGGMNMDGRYQVLNR